MADWAVVVECASPGSPPLDLVVIDRLVEHLARWRATALHSPDRYALQVVVDAEDPLSALNSASEVHENAIRALNMPNWHVVRVEAMTVAELARGREFPSSMPPLLPKRVWEICPNFAIRMYDVGRELIRAGTIAEIHSVLARFVADSGGWIVEAGEGTDSVLPGDFSLDEELVLRPAAEPMSSSRLLLEEALPTLIADARVLGAKINPPRGSRPARSDSESSRG